MAKLVLSTQLEAMAASASMVISQTARDMTAAGRDVIPLSMGEPDFDTPPHIREAAKQAIDNGETRYTAVDGTFALKSAIRKKFARDNGLEYSQDEVTASSGGKFLIFAAMLATLHPGDEVIIPAPYWVSYPDIVRFAGGTPIIVQTGEKLVPTAEAIEAVITEKTRWLILNSPGNPSGAVITRAELEAIGQVLERHSHVWGLTDDIYEHIYFGERTPTLVSLVPSLKDRTLIVNGASKAYAMTGWRLGFGAGPEALIAAIRKLGGQSTSNPCSIAQAAGVAAFEGDHSYLDEWRATFQARRDLVVGRLNKMGLSCRLPGGAFYAFPSCSSLIGKQGPGGKLQTDADVCLQLLETEGVAAVPGTSYGTPGYLRLSYAAGTELLEEALGRMARFVATVR